MNDEYQIDKLLQTDLIGAEGTYMYKGGLDEEAKLVPVRIRGVFWGQAIYGHDNLDERSYTWKVIAENTNTGRIYPKLLLSRLTLNKKSGN